MFAFGMSLRYNQCMAEGEAPRIDKLLGKVQTRRELGNKDSKVTTDRRPTREDLDASRSPTARLIRGSLAATLKDIKRDPEMKMSMLPGFVAESRKMADNLDILDMQFNTTGQFLEAGKGPEKKNSIYSVTLDLKKPSNEPDTRVPWVMIGGAYSTSEQNAALSMALALQGEKVIILTHPEQMQDQEGGRGLKDSLRNTAKEDIDMFEKAIVGFGLSQINLLGDSLGGAFALAMTADPEFTKQVAVGNVVILQPVGFEKRSLMDLMKDGSLQEQMNENDPEAKVIMALQGNTDARRKSGLQLHELGPVKRAVKGGLAFVGPGRASGTHLNTAETVAQAVSNISGDLEIWSCGEDTLARPDTIRAVVADASGILQAKDGSRLASYTVQGARHNEFILHGFGFIRARFEEQAARHQMGYDGHSSKDMSINIDTLERSGAEYLLKGMKSAAKS